MFQGCVVVINKFVILLRIDKWYLDPVSRYKSRVLNVIETGKVAMLVDQDVTQPRSRADGEDRSCAFDLSMQESALEFTVADTFVTGYPR